MQSDAFNLWLILMRIKEKLNSIITYNCDPNSIKDYSRNANVYLAYWRNREHIKKLMNGSYHSVLFIAKKSKKICLKHNTKTLPKDNYHKYPGSEKYVTYG